MKEETVEVKTGSGADEKVSTVTLKVPGTLKEAEKMYGEEKLLKLANRMAKADKLNAERVALKGGEAKIKRKKVKELASKLLEDEDLMARIAEELGEEL